ncbi:SDR family NAD(P)-dependent oxidoreductase, partial [Salmonella enterica subsp. enterica serovar Kentucky]|nr:SDR family NAD(P)-dependent oxidoreductase [Salmonella enterica subsp. enterica serovar Kentucky]
IKAKGVDSFAIQANVADADEVKAMIKEVVSQFGSLDVLVNNAGITRDNLLMRTKTFLKILPMIGKFVFVYSIKRVIEFSPAALLAQLEND